MRKKGVVVGGLPSVSRICMWASFWILFAWSFLCSAQGWHTFHLPHLHYSQLQVFSYAYHISITPIHNRVHIARYLHHKWPLLQWYLTTRPRHSLLRVTMPRQFGYARIFPATLSLRLPIYTGWFCPMCRRQSLSDVQPSYKLLPCGFSRLVMPVWPMPFSSAALAIHPLQCTSSRPDTCPPICMLWCVPSHALVSLPSHPHHARTYTSTTCPIHACTPPTHTHIISTHTYSARPTCPVCNDVVPTHAITAPCTRWGTLPTIARLGDGKPTSEGADARQGIPAAQLALRGRVCLHHQREP